MKYLYRFSIFTSFFILIIFSVVFPQQAENIKEYSIAGTEVREIKSAINGQDYELYIKLPFTYYQDTTKKYPAVYFCDGFYDFPMLTCISGNEVFDQTMTDCFLVGFSYKGKNPNYDSLRVYDYSPMKIEDKKYSGGGVNFLKVVEKEFIPLIEKNYRVDTTFRALGGSSMGGMFTIYAMLTRPKLFNAYMIISPLVNDWLLKYEKNFYKNNKKLEASVFLSMAENDLPWMPLFMKGIKAFNKSMQKHKYAGIRYKYRFIDDTWHAGTKGEGYTRALKFIFEPLAAKQKQQQLEVKAVSDKK